MPNPNAPQIKASVGAVLVAAQSLMSSLQSNASQLASMNAPASAAAVTELHDNMELSVEQLQIIFNGISDVE